MSGALDGIRVLDLGRVLAAPFAAQMLGDLGADVIKVERPGSGDGARRYGFSAVTAPDGGRSLESSFYISANRNKRAITCDLTTPDGQEIVSRLASQSDVLIENYKVGDLARYGLDAESLRRLNPRLIYCSITGFGQTGPDAARPGFDGLSQAMGGQPRQVLCQRGREPSRPFAVRWIKSAQRVPSYSSDAAVHTNSPVPPNAGRASLPVRQSSIGYHGTCPAGAIRAVSRIISAGAALARSQDGNRSSKGRISDRRAA